MNNKGNVWLGIGIAFLIVLFIVLIIGGWIAGTYNTLVAPDTGTAQSWGNVQSAYQRRADLIPNLVETVKGARDFEKSTQTEIAQLRSQAGSIQQNVQNAKTTDELQTAGNDMNGVLSRLLVVVEAYPDLKSNQNFLSLQDELAGTENRIKFERDNYNKQVMVYQTTVRSFPTNMLA